MLVCRASIASPNSRSHDDPHMSRRSAVVLPVLLPLLTLRASPVSAAQVITNKEVDNASSPFIQELLRRTDEKKDERKAERLKDYYRRNYQDYFQFMDGSNMSNSGIDEETQKQIRAWLEENGIKPRGGK
jgi:hypothetical protein